MSFIRAFTLFTAAFVLCVVSTSAQNGAPSTGRDEKAEVVISKAVQILGGETYLKTTSQIGRGTYSFMRDHAVVSFQSFTDVIVFPDKERTEFKGSSGRTIQANSGGTGWVYDAEQKVLKVQTDAQISNFKLALRTSLDYLLKGAWRSSGELSYVGKRQATLGKRNDVVRVTFKDGFWAEFEFSDDGLPQKSIYMTTAVDGETIKEEDHYAQFVEVNGIKTPFIIDRLRGGEHVSRINYESVVFNKAVPSSYFSQPSSPKDIKSDLKF